MKKKYIVPALSIEEGELQSLICYSIGKVDGDTDIQSGGIESGTNSGDARQMDIWDEGDDFFGNDERW